VLYGKPPISGTLPDGKISLERERKNKFQTENDRFQKKVRLKKRAKS
jgi:hypothetical protein